MTPVHILFYIFAAIALVSAVIVITAKNPVRSVLSLVVTFFAMAGIWMLLRAEFLSLILVLVYVGAVMTLFLFVVMMLNIDTEGKRPGFVRYFPAVILLGLIMVVLIISVVGHFHEQLPLLASNVADQPGYSNLVAVGTLLYTDYVYAFEIAGVILLAAMIAAITLAHRGPIRRKVQNIDAQINVRPEDRVRLISMPSEPKPGKKA